MNCSSAASSSTLWQEIAGRPFLAINCATHCLAMPDTLPDTHCLTMPDTLPGTLPDNAWHTAWHTAWHNAWHTAWQQSCLRESKPNYRHQPSRLSGVLTMNCNGGELAWINTNADKTAKDPGYSSRRRKIWLPRSWQVGQLDVQVVFKM